MSELTLQAAARLASIVEQLLAKSKSGDIEWQRTAKADSFMAPFSKYSVHIRQVRIQSEYPDEELFDYYLEIFNAEGDLLESIVDTDFQPVPRDQFNAYKILGDLYMFARRQALGVDRAIDALLTDLRVSPAEIDQRAHLWAAKIRADELDAAALRAARSARRQSQAPSASESDATPKNGNTN